MDRVAERVIILVSDSPALPPSDKEIVHRIIESVLREKGFIAWLETGILTMDPDVLAQLLSQSSITAQIKQQRSLPEDFQGPTNVSSVSCTESRQCYADQSRGNHTVQLSARKTRHELEKQIMQQPQGVPTIQHSHPPATTTKWTSTGAPGLVKSKLRYGVISRQPQDVDIWRPGFDVPEHVAQSLKKNYWSIPEAGVKIVLDPKDKSLRWSVYPKGVEGIEVAANEVVVLQSKLRFGKISRQPGDVEIWRPGFDVPERIAQNLMENYRNISEAGVKIVSDPRDKSVRWSVWGEGADIATNEVVVLQSRVRYGDVSFEESDLFFLYPGWKIPQYIIESIKRDHRETRRGELYIISDERGNLRYKVDITLIDRAASLMMKTRKRL